MLVSNVDMTKQPMFLTWQLWNALRYPMRRHPIFLFAQQPHLEQHQNSRTIWFLGIGAGLLLFILALISLTATLVTILALGLILPALIFLFNGTVLGLNWVANLNGLLFRSYRNQRFDLMSITPYGVLGVYWLIASGIVHRNNRLKQVYRIVNWVVSLVVAMLLLASLMLLFGALTAGNDVMRQTQFNVLRDVISITTLVLALWLDHIQSIVISISVGILTSRLLSQQQLQWLSPILFLIIQLISYIVIFITYILLRVIIIGLFGTTLLSSILIAISTLTILYLWREAIISGLWRLILHYHDTTPEEYQLTMQMLQNNNQH